MLRIALSSLLLALVASAVPAARAGPWRRPVEGPLLRAFRLAADPYAPGQHRGVDLAAARGSPARSACKGRVSFAGRVPGGGRTVSIRCGALVASYQQLGTIAVGPGQRVARGARIGAVGRSSDPRERRPHLHLGVREIASGRYVDPMTLLAGAPPRALPLRAPGRIVPPRPVGLGPAPLRVRPALRAPGRIVAPRPVGLGPAPLRVRPALRAPGRIVASRPVGLGPAPLRVRPALRAPGRIVASRPVGLGPAPLPVRPALPALRPTVELRPQLAPGSAAPDAAPAMSGVVWVGLAAIASALPVGGFVVVRRRRPRRTRQRVAAVR